jgi:hypothetical protein
MMRSTRFKRNGSKKPHRNLNISVQKTKYQDAQVNIGIPYVNHLVMQKPPIRLMITVAGLKRVAIAKNRRRPGKTQDRKYPENPEPLKNRKNPGRTRKTRNPEAGKPGGLQNPNEPGKPETLKPVKPETFRTRENPKEPGKPENPEAGKTGNLQDPGKTRNPEP